MSTPASKYGRPTKVRPSKDKKDSDVLVCNLDIDKLPSSRQETEIELWGVLPEDEFAFPTGEFHSQESDLASEQRKPIHEGQLIGEGFLSKVRVTSVAVGKAHVALVGHDGLAYTFGRNDRGQLGLGHFDDPEDPDLNPRQVKWDSTDREGGGSSSSTSPSLGTSEFVMAVACGASHTVFLTRNDRAAETSPKSGSIFTCGCWDSLGIDIQPVSDHATPKRVCIVDNVTAIAAKGDATCSAAPPRDTARNSEDHNIYLWGDVRCCLRSDCFATPKAVFRIPAPAKAVALGGFFGLALTLHGEVYAWGDGTYGELGGADAYTASGEGFGFGLSSSELPLPGRVQLPNDSTDDSRHSFATSLPEDDAKSSTARRLSSTSRGKSSMAGGGRGRSRVADIACGDRHCLLLDEEGRLYAFGDNLAGQCGVPEAVGAGHLAAKNSVPLPRHVPIEVLQRGTLKSEDANRDHHEFGARVFAGRRHSAMVTNRHHVYVWGHPANRKLGHAGFNADGTEAGEDPHKKRPPGVAVRSPLRDAVRRPRLVYSLLHRRVETLGLGDECTVIVSGNGSSEETFDMPSPRGEEITIVVDSPIGHQEAATANASHIEL